MMVPFVVEVITSFITHILKTIPKSIVDRDMVCRSRNPTQLIAGDMFEQSAGDDEPMEVAEVYKSSIVVAVIKTMASSIRQQHFNTKFASATTGLSRVRKDNTTRGKGILFKVPIGYPVNIAVIIAEVEKTNNL